MTTSSIGSTSSTTASSSSSSSSSNPNSLTMSDFLELMTTQLKNQNPTDPTDSSTFLNEMAQMSTVEGVTSMQSSLSTLSNSLLASSAISSANLVGKDVLAAATSSTYTSGNSISGEVTVPSGASGVTLNIENSSGTVVKSISLSNTTGNQSFTWDGTNSSGTDASSGTYTFSATATVNGASKSLTTLLPGTVSTVSIDSSTNTVTLNTSQLGSVALSSVVAVD